MKIPSLLVVLTLIITASKAQLQFGVKGGLNLSSVAYINTENSKARLGYNAGLAFGLPLQETIFLQPEVLYSSKGFGFNAEGFSGGGSVRLNYIAIPVLFGLQAFNKTSFLVGPEFGFLSKAVSHSQGIATDRTNFYRHFDLGIDLGVDYNLSNNFAAQFRYNYGFKNLVNVVFTDQNGNITGQGKNGANRVLQVGVVYWLSR